MIHLYQCAKKTSASHSRRAENFMLKKWSGLHPSVAQKHRFPLTAIGILLFTTLVAEPTNANLTASSRATPKNSAESIVLQAPYTISLKELGAGNSMSLFGQDGRASLNFNASANEVISQASLKLFYKYSPDLLSKNSRINVYLNDERIASLETPNQNGNKDLEVDIAVPIELFSENNQFTFQLVGHYESNCEDARSPKLWAKIGGKSSLSVSSIPLVLSNNLANLPIPFTSKNSTRKLTLPFVFMAKPNNAALESAGIAASWLGSKTIQSGAKFPVMMNSFPDTGNAIVFIDAATSAVPGIALPSITGPMVFITSNPKDPSGKYLFVMGKNGSELKQAITSLALGNQNLSGQSASLTETIKLPARQPYDAPNWLSGTGPVKLSNLKADAQFNTEFNTQLPPDLYDINKKGIPLHLDYSYINNSTGNSTDLSVVYKRQPVKTIPLETHQQWIFNINEYLTSFLKGIGVTKKINSEVTKEADFYIPQGMLYPSYGGATVPNDDQINLAPFLKADFIQSSSTKTDCTNIGGITPIDAKLNPSSTINISKMNHFIGMPNLAAFSNSGFPFSRLADLSETAAILPDNPNVEDYSAYLATLGRIGRLTGYPSTSITTTTFSQIESAKNKDLLIFTSGPDNQSILKGWEHLIPSSNRFSVEKIIVFLQNIMSSSSKFDIYKNTFITGFQSPLESGRSVILISSLNPEKMNDLTSSFDGSMGSIYGSLVRLNEDQVETIFDKETYQSGDLPFSSYLAWYFSKYGLLFTLLISIFAVLALTALIYLSISRIKLKRLRS
jgi:hypothetical protein